MPTNLIDQSARADDDRFRSQVRAVLMRELPNLLKTAPGDYYAPGTGNVAQQNAGKAQAFGRELDTKHESTVQRVARAVAGEPDVIAINKAASAVAPVSVYEIADAQESTLITTTKKIVRALAEIVV